jgi:UDP-N-acetylglucosamine acyltransferase
MPIAQSARIHPTAIIDPTADIGEGVEIGPFVVVEKDVKVGTGSIIRTGAHLVGPTIIGCNNTVFSHAVLGEQPQHLRYNGEPARLVIGDNNIIREHVTIHRGMSVAGETRVGNNNFLMANCHIAHDCRVGNNCILANGALLAGHCVLENNVYISGNSAIHQFVRVGRLALLSGVSSSTMDIPPFILQNRVNAVVGLNVVGMRRAGIPGLHIDAVRKAFHILYREGHVLPEALALIERNLGQYPEVAEMVAFIRAPGRGITLNSGLEAA